MTTFEPEAGPKWCRHCERRSFQHHADGRCWTPAEFADWFEKLTGLPLEGSDEN